MSKKFKFGESVYVVLAEDNGYRLVRGIVAGIRKYGTASDLYVYFVETAFYNGYFFSNDIYKSVEEFKEEAINHVVE